MPGLCHFFFRVALEWAQWGAFMASKGVVIASTYIGRTQIARAAAATVVEVGA